ncbi:4-(cytidine 5'-diphospho)-2-C-methyl-D-erythritol kinase [Schaalia georgiae]|uniref:4-(cytidine 5'-diphospho)-2-C-methyl-D-erythritol kinase n=1 Tax=Schaalia georgiae TaxID=52768 RepID=UPI000409FCC0|nr:4-(cytidine 5'-diphospho)-2-C-methyl-D-erythritol kinase [Schaalia georgiae]
MREVTASAPGKVNLVLRAGAPTADGYHPLATVFEALDLRETVTVRTTRTPGTTVETVAHLPGGDIDRATGELMRAVPPRSHLAVRAARAMQRLAAAGPWASTAAGLAIRVDKRVPVAGGMAGGSADAAATLVACNELWGLGLGPGQLERIGRALGADVPACLTGGIALGTGRGDHMAPLECPGTHHHWVIALAHEGLSTADVFAEFDRAAQGTAVPAAPTDEELADLTGPARLAGPRLVNDLTAAALSLRPELGGTLSASRAAGALAAIVSGSGPTVAALASSADHADEIAERLAAAPAVARVLTTMGPAPGARVEHQDER